MYSISNLWVTALFYVPMVSTYIHPLLGLTVSTGMVFWHYRYQPFKRALDKLVPEPLDPMEIDDPNQFWSF